MILCSWTILNIRRRTTPILINRNALWMPSRMRSPCEMRERERERNVCQSKSEAVSKISQQSPSSNKKRASQFLLLLSKFLFFPCFVLFFPSRFHHHLL